MGSTSSRHGSRPRTPRRPKQNLKRTLSSIFICGSSSSTSRIQMEDDSAEECRDLDNTAKFQRPRKEIALPSSTEYHLTEPKKGHEESNVVVNENPSPKNGAGTSVNNSSSCIASTSNEDRRTPNPSSSNERVKMNSVFRNDDVIERITQSDLESPRAFEGLLGVENEIPEREVADLGSVDDTVEETIPSLLGFLDTEREQEHRDEVAQCDDVTSISSDNLSTVNPEMNPHESRFDGRRLIWDAVLRQNGGRLGDSQTFTFSTDDSSDHSGSRATWLRGFGDDSLDGGARGDGSYLGSRTHNIAASRQRSSSEIWESIRRGSNGYHRRTGRCPSGLHAYGTCSCDISMAQDGGPRASISRIVMLAETLFEVLDEIQRQPVPLSLPMGLLPAPESVVDSLPVKIHRIKHESGNDIQQCHICLAEYDEGDEIRVLPCHHEYHTSCVDKWLKEIHRLCPLCRGDVCGDDAHVSNPETPLA